LSTRGEIGYLRPDGCVKVIYNHYDSYLEGLGKDLVTAWNSSLSALKVVKGEYNESEWKYFYTSVEEWLDSLNNSDREYAYLWKNNDWYFTYPKKCFWVNDWIKVKVVLGMKTKLETE